MKLKHPHFDITKAISDDRAEKWLAQGWLQADEPVATATPSLEGDAPEATGKSPQK